VRPHARCSLSLSAAVMASDHHLITRALRIEQHQQTDYEQCTPSSIRHMP
jgi:hypothetical protein